MRKSATLIALVTFSLAVTGCASSTPDPVPPASASSSAPTPSPTPSATRTSVADAGITERSIDGFALDSPWSDAGLAPVEGCAWVGSAPAEGFTLWVQREEGAPEDAPIVLVQVTAPSQPPSAVGPTTEAGIGIGSSVDEARAAYPDASVIESVGDRRYLQIDDDLFLHYTEGAGEIWGVSVTSLEIPPYESCA